MKKNYEPIIFDIETAAFSFEEVKHLAPPEILKMEMSEEDIQTYADGLNPNWKPETKMQKAREFAFKYNPQDAQDKWMSKAALDPHRSFVCWIGYKQGEEYTYRHALEPADEFELLRDAHSRLALGGIGLNSNKFDLPFLYMRAILNDVTPIHWRKGRYAKDEFIDLREDFEQMMGDRYRLHPANMNYISKVFGWDQKPGDAIEFAGWLKHGYMDKCTEYSKHDLDITQLLAYKLGATTKLDKK